MQLHQVLDVLSKFTHSIMSFDIPVRQFECSTNNSLVTGSDYRETLKLKYLKNIWHSGDTFSLFLSIFYISLRLTLWYFVFLYLIFLSQQVLYFLLSTLVLTLYIDVVLSLSIRYHRQLYDNHCNQNDVYFIDKLRRPVGEPPIRLDNHSIDNLRFSFHITSHHMSGNCYR